METSVSKFLDLVDVPNCYSTQSSCLVVNQSGDGLTFSTEIKLDDIKTSKVECGDLNVLKDSHFEGPANMKSIFCENISCDKKLSVQEIKTTNLESQSLKSSKIESDISQINNIEAVCVRAKDLNSEACVVNSLRVVDSLDIPPDLYVTNIKNKNIISEVGEISDLKSVCGSIDALTSQNLLAQTLKVDSCLVRDLATTSVDSEIIVCDKFQLRSSQIEGCKDIPVIKEVPECSILPQISSKYVWYGKQTSPSKLIRLKVNSVLDVLADYVPVVSFHTYETLAKLPEGFKVDTFVYPCETTDSFIVDFNFNNNLPATSKFIISIILQRI